MEFDEEVSQRLLKIVNKEKIRQSALMKKCRECNMPITQSDISKIYNGKKLSLYQAASISKALGVSLDYLVNGISEKKDFFEMNNSTRLVSDPKKEEYRPYLGKMFCYFISTSDNEDKLITGVVTVEPREKFCEAGIEIDTGEKDIVNEPIIKPYDGRLFVSNAMSSAYFILKCESLGEICTIILRHRLYAIKQVECRIGLCLTTCAGENKVPTVHRILFTRHKLDHTAINKIKPWLKVYGRNILIEKSKYQNLLKDFSMGMPEYSEEFEHIYGTARYKEYYCLSSEVLRQQLSLNRNEFVEFMTRIYSEAEADNNIKITQSDDSKIFDMLEKMLAAIDRDRDRELLNS